METDRGLAKKLLLKPGSTFLVVDAPDAFSRSLADASQEVKSSGRADDRQFDLVQVFVRHRADLENKRQPAVDAVRPGGILWITYPKQSGSIKSDINRDSAREVMKPTGWRPVTQVSIDETWSALRFKPEGEVGRR